MQEKKVIKFSGPASYTISIQGSLSEELLSYFEGIKVKSEKKSDTAIITTLECRIKDQSELSGIINTLYEWRYPILLVECEGETIKDI